MRINYRHIVFIEPVAPNSKVALLIREAELPPAGAPPRLPIRPNRGRPAGKKAVFGGRQNQNLVHSLQGLLGSMTKLLRTAGGLQLILCLLLPGAALLTYIQMSLGKSG
jgi:hypothetical protein